MDKQSNHPESRQHKQPIDSVSQPALFHRMLTADEARQLQTNLDSDWMPGNSQEFRIVLQIEKDSQARGWIICADTSHRAAVD